MTTINEYFQIASREDFESSQHKEMINVRGNGFANYPDLVIEIYTHTQMFTYI